MSETKTGFVVNPDLAGDTPSGGDSGEQQLPPGVFLESQPTPEGRVELFRVNGRKYTVPAVVNPRVVFRYMRALRKGGAREEAMADMLYDVLGEAVVDALADEDLSAPEFNAVMVAISKYTMSAMDRAGLGNS